MVQKLSFTANSVVLGAGNSRVILGADSGKLIVKDRHANTSTVLPGSGIVGATSVSTYANNSVLPMSPVSSAGSLAYSTANNTLFLSNGSGWYKITTVNEAPTITLSSTVATPTQTSLTLDYTYTTTEPEGTPVTVTLANSGIATVGNVAITHTTSNNHVRLVFDGSTVYSGATVTLSVTDGVNIGTGTITINTAYLALNSRYADIVIKADGNNKTNSSFTDGGGSNHTVTSNGDARISSFCPFHPAGYSAYFDGASTNHIDAPASGNFLIGTGAFTLEAWVICEQKNTDTYYRRLYSHDGPTGNAAGNFQVAINPSTGSADMWSNSGDLDLQGTIAIDDGEWHHLAFVRNGTALTSYVDGKLSKTGTYNVAIGTQNSSQPRPRIGAYGGGSGDFKGYIHSLRLVVGTAVYTAEFAPSGPLTNITNTKLLMTLSPIPRDGSSAGHKLTQTGQGLEHHRKQPKDFGDYAEWNVSDHGFSLAMNGDGGDYLNHNDIGMSGRADFTMEGWVYPTGGSFNPWANPMYSQGNASSLASEFIYYGWDSVGKTVMFSNKSNNNTPSVEGSADDIVLNQWHHLAFVRASNQASIYVNGVKKAGPTSLTGSMPAAPTGRAYIGAQSYDPSHANRCVNGYISDFRIHNTALYTNDFTPPTAKLTATSGTQYLMATGSNPGIYDFSASHTRLELEGNAKSSTAQKKYSASSMLFDGTGDVVKLTDDSQPLLDFGSEDFTMEGWYRADATNGDHYIISAQGGTFSNSTSHYGINIYQGNWRVGGFDDKLIGGAGSGVNTGINTGAWHHFAWIHANRKISFYVDGTQTGSTVDVGSDTFDCAGSFKIGGFHSNSSSGNWDGHLEDIRITKGLSRYPFIPLKETLTTQSSAQNGITCTASNVKLLALTTGTVTQDISSTNHTITNVNTVASSNFGPLSPMKSALFVAASNEKLTIPDGTWKTWGSTFTVECWIYANSYPHSTQNYIWGDYNSGGASSSTSINLIANNSRVLYVSANIGGSLSTILTSPVAMDLNKWHHVAVVRNSNNWYLFLNGTIVHENTSATGTVNDSSEIFAIGGTGNFTGRGWDGYISNFRVNNAQALYTKNFAVPTTELF